MIKIKVKPEDFGVDEIASIPYDKNGDFGIFFLKKSGWNTVDVLQRLSKRFKIPFSEFSYGGRKDKYALTTQYISVARRRCKQILNSPPQQSTPKVGAEFTDNNYTIRFMGFMEKPMTPEFIKGNRFSITVRNLTDDDIKSAVNELEYVKREGYPNYFDDQRFGSFDDRQGFIAEKIVRGHYNGALKIYFTRFHPADSKEEKEHKKLLDETWGDWSLCLKAAKTSFEREAFEYLTKNPKGFIPILQRIHYEEMSIFFSAYQSHLWNTLLRKVIESVAKDAVRTHKGMIENYSFYKQLDTECFNYLQGLSIPTPASNTRMPDTLTESRYSALLTNHEIKPAWFNIKSIRQAFFKCVERKAIVFPGDLSAEQASDEIYCGKKKLILRFFLPRGSFGTMLIKRLFSHTTTSEVKHQDNETHLKV